MRKNGGNEEQGPKLCKNGCGFFGAPSTKDFCSKCHINFLKTGLNMEKSTRKESSSTGMLDIANKKISKSRNRCEICKKRVGLLGFECRLCSGYYCGIHRFPEEHQDRCSFDFKKTGSDELAKQLPLVMSDKLETRV